MGFPFISSREPFRRATLPLGALNGSETGLDQIEPTLYAWLSEIAW